MNTMNTMSTINIVNTIPEIAELLRHHINTDNDAERLICEHILPLVGIVDPEEYKNEVRDELDSLRRQIEYEAEEAKRDIQRRVEQFNTSISQ